MCVCDLFFFRFPAVSLQEGRDLKVGGGVYFLSKILAKKRVELK